MAKDEKFEPSRATQTPPRSSWWATPQVQQSRPAFDAEAAKEAVRMNAVQTAYNKPGQKE